MRLALAAVAAVSLAATAQAAPKVSPQVIGAWSRPAAQGTTGAGFMTLSNPGAKADALVSVASPLAKGVTIHQSMLHGSMSMMQPVTTVPVPAGGSVTFAPGGYHLMFLELTKPLNVGDAVPATLTFASGATVKATFVVGLAPPVAPASKR